MKQMKADGSHALCLPRLFGSFGVSRILWTHKQTHFRYFFGDKLFSMDLLREGTAERQFDGMEAAALYKEILGHRDVLALVHFLR